MSALRKVAPQGVAVRVTAVTNVTRTLPRHDVDARAGSLGLGDPSLERLGTIFVPESLGCAIAAAGAGLGDLLQGLRAVDWRPKGGETYLLFPKPGEAIGDRTDRVAFERTFEIHGVRVSAQLSAPPRACTQLWLTDAPGPTLRGGGRGEAFMTIGFIPGPARDEFDVSRRRTRPALTD